ncbi:uncharacterized protein DNG_09007 [Cephalotrichum gorgonifer]|uniref:Uncharacterized protein n=1 Tax=Cephalotrichum gorgonifer TaxID=2041049 RepID=A0AAE8N6Q0_9PEZI|nr:uncharacterized protein DNG_09007 [Cephalotrichum gorgonifer]
MNLSTAFALAAFVALSKLMGVTASSSTYGTMDPDELYYGDYEEAQSPMVELLEKSTNRTEFTAGSLTIVRGWPSTGGFYTLSCDGVELEFLSLDRFEPTPRSQDPAEEDAFCANMRKLGAHWYSSEEELVADSLRGAYETNFMVKAFGWPADGGVWALKMPYMDSEMKGIGRIRNAFSMEESPRSWNGVSPDFPSGAKVLWIHGPAGFGKTIPKVVRDAFLAARSWTSQLVSQHDGAFQYVLQRQEVDTDPSATRHTITSLFENLVRLVPECTFVLDGLDECVHLDGTSTSVANFLHATTNAIAGTATRILIISRFLADVQRALKRDDRVTLSEYKLGPDDVQPDIAAYSRDIVDRKLSNKNPVLRSSLSGAIDARCERDTSFGSGCRENPCGGACPRDSWREAVEETPTELDRVYDHNWKRIDQIREADRRRACALLRWDAFGLRPLAIEEVAEAVVIEESDCDDLAVEDLYDTVDDDYTDSEILGLYRPLLEVKTDHLDMSRGPMDFAPTALYKVGLCFISLPSIWKQKSSCNPTIGTKFLSYAASSWHRHVLSGEEPIKTSGALYQAVKLELMDLVALLVQSKKCDVNEGSDRGMSPVVVASASGVVAVVKLLLEKGADITKDSPAVTPAFTPAASTEDGGGGGGPNSGVTRWARRSWTAWEDQTLISRIAQFGDGAGARGRWGEIAQDIPGRTPKACRKRWLHSLDPSLRKGKWTEEEDRILLEAYARLGPAWNEIAHLIPGRKDDQCSKRHRGILGPLAKNRLSDWTKEEDRILTNGVRDLGHSWTSVAARLPGRPPLTCRNRWRHLCRQNPSLRTGDEQQTSPGSGQPSQESDTPGQSASPGISREGDNLERPFNFQDPIGMGMHEVTTSQPMDTSSSHVTSQVQPGPDPMIGRYAQLPFSHVGQDESAATSAHGGLLNTTTTTGFQGFPDMNFGDADYWNLDSAMSDSGTGLAVGASLDATLQRQPSTSASMQALETTAAPTQLPQGPPAADLHTDYAALEAAAETASRRGQQLPSIAEEPRNQPGAPRAGIEGETTITTIITIITIITTITTTTTIIIITIKMNPVWLSAFTQCVKTKSIVENGYLCGIEIPQRAVPWGEVSSGDSLSTTLKWGRPTLYSDGIIIFARSWSWRMFSR